DVPSDPKEPRKRGPLALVLEPASPQPSAREDFGCQVDSMFTDPRPRPRQHLGSVSVVDLLKRISGARAQKLRVRRRSEITSHNLYLSVQRKMCHACRCLRPVASESGP